MAGYSVADIRVTIRPGTSIRPDEVEVDIAMVRGGNHGATQAAIPPEVLDALRTWLDGQPARHYKEPAR